MEEFPIEIVDDEEMTALLLWLWFLYLLLLWLL